MQVNHLFNGATTKSALLDAYIQSFLQQSDATDILTVEEIQALFKDTLLPDKVVDFAAYLVAIKQKILNHATHLNAPTFIGHMTSRLPDFIYQLSSLVVAFNQNVIKIETSKGFTFQEKQVIAMMHRLIYDFDEGFYAQMVQSNTASLGYFTSGGTLSNISAMWIALNGSVDCEGSRLKYWLKQGYQDVVILGSELLHYSFDKAADLLGLTLIRCPVNENYQLDIEALEQVITACEQQNKKIIALVAIAGTTDFGSIDDFNAIARLAELKKIHFHIDAAWGGAFILSPQTKQLLAGIKTADTVTIDGHKQFMLPIGSGMLFFKDPVLSRLNMHHAPYAVRPDSLDIGRFTLEGTRAANGLYLHAALSILGQQGYATILQQSLVRASYLANRIKALDSFQLIVAPKTNILLYRYIPTAFRQKVLTANDNLAINQFNIQLQQRQKEIGRSFVSRTSRTTHLYPQQPLVLLRAVLFNPMTQQHDIDFVLQDQLSIAKQLEQDSK